MNVRHTAALVLVGWYLMVPPVHLGTVMGPMGFNKTKGYFKGDAPLSEWWKQDTFETLLDCQEGRIVWIRNERYAEKPEPGKTILYHAMLEAICVPSDDPRLKGK